MVPPFNEPAYTHVERLCKIDYLMEIVTEDCCFDALHGSKLQTSIISKKLTAEQGPFFERDHSGLSPALARFHLAEVSLSN